MNSYIDQIPVVFQTLRQFPENSLEDTFILACQHLLMDAHLFFRALRKIGLKSENVAIMGKCYSTNSSIVQKMRQDGFEVFIPAVDFDSYLSFDEQFKKHVTNFLNIQLSEHDFSKFKRVIILDDGGELIIAANELLSELKNVVGVEQTSNGFNRVKEVAMKFPMINVARCNSKLNLESPIIARIILDNLEQYLNSKRLTPRNYLIIGHGPIGRSLYKKLEVMNKNVNVYDSDIDRSDIHRYQFEEYLSNADVILGSSGVTAVPHSLHKLLKKNCILASASSSDREFDAVYLRQLSKQTYDCHSDLIIKDIHLLNCGFPINFSGGIQSMPLLERQLVMSLLIAGICQANRLSEHSTRIIEIDFDQEKSILKNFKIYGNEFLPESIFPFFNSTNGLHNNQIGVWQ